MPDRWRNCQQLYREAELDVVFKTYEGIGHEVNEEVMRDLVKFYRDVLK
jgi:hypothetical protein